MGWNDRLGHFHTCGRCREGYIIPWEWSDELERKSPIHTCDDILKKEMEYEFELSKKDSSNDGL